MRARSLSTTVTHTFAQADQLRRAAPSWAPVTSVPYGAVEGNCNRDRVIHYDKGILHLCWRYGAMHERTSLACLSCAVTLAFALTTRAQESEEPPPWETGDDTTAPAAEVAPAHEPVDDEAPPDLEPEDDGEPDEEESPIDSRADAGLVLGAKVGGGLGTSDFGATPVFELELGYAPDLGGSIGHSLEIFLIGQYAQPGLDGRSAPDPRFPGGAAFSYEVTQQMFSLSLGALFRFDVGSELLMPYGGLGGRLYLMNTEVEGSVMGESLGTSNETQSTFGLVVLGGLEAFVGPGALLGELSFGWSAVDGYILRETNVGALSLAVGYRVML
jgi:hypothetical protein